MATETTLTSTSTGGTQETTQFLSGVDVQTSPVHVGNAEYEELIPEDAVNITVGIFFDGTLNNRSNTQAREEYEKKERGESYDSSAADSYTNWIGIKKSGSFDNEHSNVSRMEPAYIQINEENNKQLSIYIEGIGTENQEGDSNWGASSGKGATGVKGKVKKGCEEIAKKLARLGIEKINVLTIDTYGFSRGAAAARNFIYEINQKKNSPKETLADGLYAYRGQIHTEDYGVLGEQLVANDIELKSAPQARFVGLYDTVASFGFYHQNDVRQLNLDAIKKARFTFHLTADDEHRSNFMLTSIGSARGKEKALPGVHSDIGGGYRDGVDEEVTLDYGISLPNLRRERQHLIDEGWYLPLEIEVDEFWGTVVGERFGISYRYSFIPLQVMVEYSIKKYNSFELNKITSKYEIRNEPGKGVNLLLVKDRIDSYVNDNSEKLSLDNPTDITMLKALRNKYFHFSAHYNDRVVGVVPPMKPNRENGVRTREILGRDI